MKKDRFSEREGFTIAELVIVIAIVLVLAGAALSGGTYVLKSLRFNNAFNKMIFMVQQARNLASTGKGDAQTYGVQFTLTAPATTAKLELFSIGTSSPDKTILDTYFIDQALQMTAVDLTNQANSTCGLPAGSNLFDSAASCKCTSPAAEIKFTRGDARVEFVCPSGDDPSGQGIKLMRFILRDITVNNAEKGFLIHKAAGIPQFL